MKKAPVVLIAVGMLLLLPTTASADSVYRSEHIQLVPVGTQPLRTGFVENIHVNGPEVFAIERYVLNGASPATTYDVALHLWIDPACGGGFLTDIPTARFTTNPAGNGTGSGRFAPADADGLHGATIGIVWTVSTGGQVAYQTACTSVTLD